MGRHQADQLRRQREGLPSDPLRPDRRQRISAAASDQRARQSEAGRARRRDCRPGRRGPSVLQQEVVVGGFTAPRNSRKYFGALIVGVYEDGKLVYTGHVGGGFDEKTLAEIYKLMKPLIVKSPHFSGPPPHANEKPTWVKPKLVVEVKFSEWTRDGVM